MRRSKRLRFGRAFAVGFLPLLAAWACGGSDSEKIKAATLAQGCSLNSECKDPLLCTFERCHEACVKDRDCTRGEERCVKGDGGNVCQLPDETGCARNADCQGDQVCGDDGECRDECTTDDDCSGDQICANAGQCASTIGTKDVVVDGEILTDPFDDTQTGAGGAGGAGPGPGSGGSGATTNGGAGGEGLTSSGGTTSGGKSGTGGKAGTGGGGTTSTGGTAGAGGMGGVPGPEGCDQPNMASCDDTSPDCETSLALVTTCGACDISCDGSHATVRCDATLTCAVTSCSAGWANCNEDGTDGCEAELAVDNANCGACNRSCGGGTCTAGACTAEVAFDPPPNQTSGVNYNYTGEAFLINDSIVKLNANSGTEFRIAALPPVKPPSPGTILAAATAAVGSATVDATRLFFSVAGTPNSTITRVALTGGPTAVAATVTGITAAVEGLTSNATALFMNAYIGGAGGPYQIHTATKLATGAAASTVFQANRGQVWNLTVVGQRLFWTEAANGTISPLGVYTAPLSGGAPVLIDDTLAQANGAYIGMATDGAYAYWTTYNGNSSRIRRCATAGTPSAAAVTDVLFPVASLSPELLVDDTHVYYKHANYTISRVLKDGTGTPESLGTFSTPPYVYDLVAVDDGFVYFTGQYGEVLRISKVPVSAE